MRNLTFGPVFRRVLLGIGANAAGKLWVLAIQLLSVPVLVTKWGANDYGIWLMLTAVPTYIALSDFGFAAAAAVDMTRRVALNDQEGALCAYQSVWAFVSSISAALLVVVGLIWAFRGHIPGFAAVRPDVANAALLLFIFALAAMQMNLSNIAFRSIGRYAQGTFFYELLMPIEGAVLLTIALNGGGFVAGASAILVVRIFGLFFYRMMLRSAAGWIVVGWSHASFSEVRVLAKPALAALSLPFSTALNVQGVVFVVGLAVSPAAAAMFGTIRTITRVPLQLIGILTRATMPEITIAHAKADQSKVNRLVTVNLLAAAATALSAALAVSLFGNWVLALLTRGHIQAPNGLFAVMSLIMALQILWTTVGSFLFSLNLQHRFTHAYAVLSAVGIPLCYTIAKYAEIQEMAATLLLADCVMVAVTFRAWFSSDSHYSNRTTFVTMLDEILNLVATRWTRNVNQQ